MCMNGQIAIASELGREWAILVQCIIDVYHIRHFNYEVADGTTGYSDISFPVHLRFGNATVS